MAPRSDEDVVAKLGPVAPSVPGSPTPPDRTSACLLAVEIEKTTIATYGELLPKVQAFPDVTRLLTRVRATARNDRREW